MNTLLVKNLGMQPYLPIWEAMKTFTLTRGDTTPDEFWCLEHYPVFTQGSSGKPEHILQVSDIPIIQTDRGGQVTYHGPGQLVIYFLMDLRRKGFGIRHLVSGIENAVISLLKEYDVMAQARPEAPGVYIGNAKICSLGLRVKRGCSYHGLSLNVNMDLTPFSYINPCGLQNITMTQMSSLGIALPVSAVAEKLLPHLKQALE